MPPKLSLSLDGGEKKSSNATTPAVRNPLPVDVIKSVQESQNTFRAPSTLGFDDDIDSVAPINISSELLQHRFFQHNDTASIEDIASKTVSRTLEADAVLIAPGDVVPGLFIVLSGAVQLICRAPDGTDIVLRVYRKGSSICPLALGEAYNSPFTLSAKCESEVALLEKAVFDEWLSTNSQSVKDYVASCIPYEKGEVLLSKVPLFADMTPSELLILLMLFTRKQYPADASLSDSSRGSSAFYIIVEGSVASVVPDAAGDAVTLETRHAGQHFGEVSLLEDIPRAERFSTREESVLLDINKARFDRFLELVPSKREEVSRLATNAMIQRLRGVTLFANLREQKLTQLSSLFKFERAGAGETLFREGDIGNLFYIVLEGTVQVLANVPNQEAPILIAERGSGDNFGEIALLEEMPRTATLKTSSPSIFLTLSREQFQQFLTIVPEKQDELIAMAAQRLATRLKLMPLFADLPDDKLVLLVSLFKFEKFEENSVVFSEGSDGDTFYLILKGVVEVLALDASGQEVVLARRGAGDHFGEVALLEGMPRTATLRALESCVCLTLTRDQFNNFLQIAPDKKDELRNMAVERMGSRLAVMPLFADLPDLELQRLASLFTFERAVEGACLFKQGDTGSTFYMVMTGSVSVATQDENGSRVIAIRQQGDYFGEIALLEDCPRMATVTCRENALFVTLSRESFNQFLEHLPDIRAKLQAQAVERHAEAGPVSNITKAMSKARALAVAESVFGKKNSDNFTAVLQASQFHSRLSTVGYTEKEIEHWMLHLPQCEESVYSFADFLKHLGDVQ